MSGGSRKRKTVIVDRDALRDARLKAHQRERHGIKGGIAVLAAALMLLFSAFSALAANPALDRFVREAPAKLESGLFGRQDLQQAQRLLGMAKGRDHLRLALLLSRYYRELAREPLDSLPLLAPQVLDAATCSQWQPRWRVKPGQRPSATDGALLPPVKQWNLTRETMPAALELARVHIAVGRTVEALRMADEFGRRFEGLPRVLAAEIAAEAMLAVPELKKAADSYEYALKGLRTLVSGDGSWLDPASPQVKARLEKALAHVRALLEVDRYGEGFIRYREARQRHRKQNDVPEAILLYEDLAEKFPASVYAEAGETYACLALFELDDRSLSEAAQQAASHLTQLQQKRREAQRVQAAAAVITALDSRITAAQTHLDRLRALPSGQAAINAAHQLGMELVESRPFGLYRAEILVRLARDAFSRQMDPALAQTLYARAWDWLEKVEPHDAAIAAFEVPGQARKISQPPQQEIGKADLFGNVERVAPGSDAIVNRRTCPWYLDDLREQCAQSLGFLAFYRGDNETALEFYSKLPGLDAATARLEKRDDWNNYRRLKWGAEHGYLFAHPEELANFRGQQRFVLLLADFHYVTERFDEAKSLYSRLLAGDFGRLSSATADYPLYAIAACQYASGDHKAALQAYGRVLERTDSTFSEDRAMYCASLMLLNMGDKTMRQRGEELLKTLANSPRRNDFVYRGRINYGLYLLDSGREQEASRILLHMPASSGDYAKLGKHLIEGK